jgi:DNA recombination protein RmuC
MDLISIFVGVLIGFVILYFLMTHKIQKIEKEKIELIAEKRAEQEKNKFLTISKEQINDNFEKIALEILKKDKQNLSDKNEALLKPLSTQITEFKERIETLSKGQSDDRSALKQEIQSLTTASKTTLESAEKLTNALTYDNKQQGNWGEMVLESILEDSGLKKNQQYTIQKGFKNAEGDLLKPDVIIHLPDEKDIVIDSKVSLVAYQNYVANTEDKQVLKEHINSIDRHIKDISLKAYENLEAVNTLDFIFVFFPIEASLLVALEQKPSLFNDALKKNVALVSPSTLMMSLKTIHHIWQSENQNKNTEEIARQAGNMYDSFVRFIESLDEVSKHLNKATKMHEQAKDRLATGKGNLIGRAEKLKELGVQSKKEIKN